MREAPGRASDVLQHCLVEEEGATLRSPRRRRMSLLISVALQTVLLGTILLVPLLVNGEKIRATILVAPSPPYRGVPGGRRQQAAGDPSRGPKNHFSDAMIFQPPVIPPGVRQFDDSRNATNQQGPWIEVPEGVPNGPLPPGLGPADRWMQKPPELPQPAPKQERKISVSEGVQQGKLIHRVDPAYTPFLKSIQAQGTVRLRAVIAKNGTVQELEVLSGPPLLVQEATKAILQWRYQPTLLNGQPVEVETQITVIFVLR